ncbi:MULTISPECIES: formate dehydrogenase accessory sulfurtransferase FdhD [unclassified Tolypothrix]|uniref:formate dehydrogenase accessory sulfurtransferase FdhD n=1 Tax=unclassified Tolypothrix TaxID=2649714 RepID=UPI0005F864EE|nr:MULTISPECIES: formate dehydrogenase accessory sulfurtransferase FdhD [unclassified Tolypothrix]MBE9087284.1 formate dehydrogenase accessory sulfurtransferase FdhD [Tolypothrix sp. LEGE 11397]UYD27436.1 formate dehydrogenase accessory sulfurtransferase FdhD [Tolypothrix sp. PCC 7712]UYD36699.1 formate dehydrogenase accessory sulfurtransferase FdhD [Tolypothrix sp. PCC 7601]BAY93611.1 formate dehydrogenase family accessory protein FdhD [Microchaete diplosiphon NIES-3275]
MNRRIGSKTKATVRVVENGKIHTRIDHLTAEEPLEIRLLSPNRTLAITMRTPGADFELAAGFLYSEGAIGCKQDIQRISYCVDESIDGEQRYNIVNVELRSGLIADLQPLERHFYTNSACGVCGKASLEALKLRDYPVISSEIRIKPEIIYSLPDKLRSAQGIFRATGGLHAAALFDLQGQLLNLQEDVGRHNTLDKLIGTALLSNELPFNNHIVMVSGRSSFEILQKSVAAGVPIVCSVSAPSHLAVSVAEEFGITLIGFLRGQKFNVYTGWERIDAA